LELDICRNAGSRREGKTNSIGSPKSEDTEADQPSSFSKQSEDTDS